MAERKIDGTVQSIDSFGNLVTSITADALSNVPRGEATAVLCDEHETRGIFNTYVTNDQTSPLILERRTSGAPMSTGVTAPGDGTDSANSVSPS